MCIDSIRQFTPSEIYEIIVVDNHSTDGTVEWLKTQKNIRTIFNKKNEGFPKGCNQGIKAARGDSVLLLNNDTVVSPNWLQNLRDCLFSSEDIGAVGAVTNSCSYYQAIPASYQNLDEMISFASDYNAKNPAKWEERLKLVGFCMLIKKQIFRSIGLLDERFTPGNYEDDDFSLRIRKAGYRLILCKDTFIHHFGSVSFRANPELFSKFSGNANKFREKWGFYAETLEMRNELLGLIESAAEEEVDIWEIDCGCGATLLKLRQKYVNSNLYGSDSNEEVLKFAGKFAEVALADIKTDDVPYREKLFDYIILTVSLQDKNMMAQLFKKIVPCLKTNGKVIIRVKSTENTGNGQQQLSIKIHTDINSVLAEAGFSEIQILNRLEGAPLKGLTEAGYQEIVYEFGKATILTASVGSD